MGASDGGSTDNESGSIQGVFRFRQAGVVGEDFRLVRHGVFLGDWPDDLAWDTGCDGIGGYVASDDRTGSDDACVANGDAGADSDIGAEPAVVADDYGFCVAESGWFSVLVMHQLSFAWEEWMERRHDRKVGTEAVVVSDRDECIVLDGQVVIEEIVVSDGRMLAVVEEYGTLDEGTFPEFVEDKFQELLADFHVVLIGSTVLGAQFVRSKLECSEFGMAGAEENASEKFVFFFHGFAFVVVVSEDFAEDLQCLGNMLGFDVQWGHQPENGLAGREDKQALGFAIGNNLCQPFLRIQFDADHQACTPDVLDVVFRILDLVQFAEEEMGLIADIVDDLLVPDDVEDFDSDCRDKRIATKCGSVVSGLQDICQFWRYLEASHRQSVGNRLGDGHCIRRDAVALVGEIGSGSRHAALDLVCEKKQVVGVAKLAESQHEFLGRGDDAAFALDRFQKYGDRLFIDQFFDGLEVVEVGEDEALHVRTEAFPVLGASRRRQRRQRTSMEGVVHADDFVATLIHRSPFSGDFDHSLVGFGAGVPEEEFSVERSFPEHLREFRGMFVDVVV